MSTEKIYIPITWDWKGQPDLRQLGAAIARASGGTVRLYPAETGTDDVGILITNDTDITPSDVERVFDESLDADTPSDGYADFESTP